MNDSDSDDSRAEASLTENMNNSDIKEDSALVCDGNEVVHFKLIRKAEDIDDDSLIFRPAMCHQIFGDQEKIYGYVNLRIKLYYSAFGLNPYLKIDYDYKKEPSKEDVLEADNIEETLSKSLQIPFERNLDEFIKKVLDEKKNSPVGDFKYLFKVDSTEGKKSFAIYHCNVETKGFSSYMTRMQTFLQWFIDAATFVDIDDEKWQFFIIYENYKVNNESVYAFAGFASVYEYFGYPAHIRPRISQVLVMPPFQNQGLCTELLKYIYNFYKDNNNVKDITVEDPSPEFQSVRDYVDCQLMLTLPTIGKADQVTLKTVIDAAKKFKLNEKQARRLYEILRLLKCNKNKEEEINAYKKEIEERITRPHRLNMKRIEKFKRWYHPKECEKIIGLLRKDEEKSNLAVSVLYPELLACYERVLNRLTANNLQ